MPFRSVFINKLRKFFWLGAHSDKNRLAVIDGGSKACEAFGDRQLNFVA
jgi:hypothetical protein